MKIEKINENQIRCTLNKSDMEEYQIKLSELAYGTDKAKALFRDMMSKANFEYGFSAEDIPLMIEAIPISAESIVLVITKVECPEELDTRFSRFTDAPAQEEEADLTHPGFMESARDVLDLFEKIARPKEEDSKAAPEDLPDIPEFVPLSDMLENISKGRKKDSKSTEKKKPKPLELSLEIDLTKLYVFDDLAGISKVARVLLGVYSGNNSLYKDPADEKYYLFLTKSSLSPEHFNKTCNIFSEYAKQSTYSPAVQAYFEEHCDVLIKGNALQVMASL